MIKKYSNSKMMGRSSGDENMIDGFIFIYFYHDFVSGTNWFFVSFDEHTWFGAETIFKRIKKMMKRKKIFLFEVLIFKRLGKNFGRQGKFFLAVFKCSSFAFIFLIPTNLISSSFMFHISVFLCKKLAMFFQTKN